MQFGTTSALTGPNLSTRPAAAALGRRLGRWQQAPNRASAGPVPLVRGFPTAATNVNLESLRARQPKELLRSDAFRMIPPEDITPHDLAELTRSSVLTDPAKVLEVYFSHAKGEEPDPALLVRTFTQLGFLFDPNSFFSTADRQIITGHKKFRLLAHDLAEAKDRLPSAAAPLLLYSMSCLEYRCGPLMPFLLDAVESQLQFWRTEVLSLILHSVASLGLGNSRRRPLTFDLQDGSTSRDYGRICHVLAEELGRRAGDFDNSGSLQDWARAAFSLVMANRYNAALDGAGPGSLLPALVSAACAKVRNAEDLDKSGWAQFFLYQTLYCVDVEKPAAEEAVKRAMPMWIQERLHQRWLDAVVLYAQPQGADKMQQDLDKALKRTHTQALLNCSAGRSWDEQHCWFAGFHLNPKIALECDSMLPLGPGRPRPSGWLTLKSRILRKIGYQVVTIHRCFWDQLSDDQKDEQLLSLRVKVGYKHSRDLQRQHEPIRQTAYRKEEPLQSKKNKTWEPLPPELAGQESASAAAAAAP